MDGRKFRLVLALTLLTCVGCGRRMVKSSLPNMVIPVECASQITLMHCDARANPPKCEGARVKYRNGCEQIVAQRGAR